MNCFYVNNIIKKNRRYRYVFSFVIACFCFACKSDKDNENPGLKNNDIAERSFQLLDNIENEVLLENSDINTLRVTVNNEYFQGESEFTNAPISVVDFEGEMLLKHRLYFDLDNNPKTGRMINTVLGAEFKYENYNLYQWSREVSQWALVKGHDIRSQLDTDKQLLEFVVPWVDLGINDLDVDIALLYQTFVKYGDKIWLDYAPDSGVFLVNPYQSTALEQITDEVFEQALSRHDDSVADYFFQNPSVQPVLAPEYEALNSNAEGNRWRPTPGLRWQYQLDQAIDTSKNVDVYNVDLSTHKDIVSNLKSQGKKIICYFSVATNETFRADSHLFPLHIQGEVYRQWKNEYWLNIKEMEAIAPIMQARLDECREKGFDGVEFDNIDMYHYVMHKKHGHGKQKGTKFRIKYKDSLRYFKWLSREAHIRGLAVGLKNSEDMLDDVVQDIEFLVIEDCLVDGTCDEVKLTIEYDKPVFMVEYTDRLSDSHSLCTPAKTYNFSTILKNRGLGGKIFEQCL